jgi:hypothetical protein
MIGPLWRLGTLLGATVLAFLEITGQTAGYGWMASAIAMLAMLGLLAAPALGMSPAPTKQPSPTKPPPRWEDDDEARKDRLIAGLRDLYVADKIALDHFERCVARVLHGEMTTLGGPPGRFEPIRPEPDRMTTIYR